MKRATALLAITLIINGIAAGQEKETRDLKGFSRINFGIAGNLEIKIGPEFSVVLQGDKSDLKEVITEVSGESLTIRHENWRFSFNEKVDIYITMPELKDLSVSGSGKARILDPVKSADLRFNVSGSGGIATADISSDKLDCRISGSGNIVLGGGSVSGANISISGSGNFTGDAVQVKDLKAGISGSGNCVCNATETLNAGVSGSGNITYKGNPKIDARVSGSGHVRSVR
ncbi:MAG: head GIN domain-containing protein [Bacteroidales bacterium]|jgi:hypothetical protein